LALTAWVWFPLSPGKICAQTYQCRQILNVSVILLSNKHERHFTENLNYSKPLTPPHIIHVDMLGAEMYGIKKNYHGAYTCAPFSISRRRKENSRRNLYKQSNTNSP
jgi:hypothetical protein